MKFFKSIQKSKDDSEDVMRTERKKSHEFYRDRVQTWRKKIALAILCVLVISNAAMLLYHPFFQITTLQIHGVQKEEKKQKINSVVTSILAEHRWGIIPSSSIFLSPQKKITQAIEETLPTRSVRFERAFPHTLTITIDEEGAKAVLVNGEKQYLLNRQGKIIREIEKTNTATIALPLLTLTVKTKEGRGEDIQEQLFDELFDLTEASDEMFQLPITTITIDATELTIPIEAKIENRFTIRLRGDKPIQPQIDNFLLVMNGKVKKEKISIREYIDLRFGERVYYK